MLGLILGYRHSFSLLELLFHVARSFFYFQLGLANVSIQDRLFLLSMSGMLQGVESFFACMTSYICKGMRLTVEAISFFADEKAVIIPELENGL